MARKRWLQRDKVERLAAQALAAGAPFKFHPKTGVYQVGPWSCAPRCDKPVTVTFAGREDDPGSGLRVMRRPTIYVDVETKCRQCEPCLRQRAARVRVAALDMYRSSARTWFLTLTFRPDELYYIRARISTRLAALGQCADGHVMLPAELSAEDRWREYQAEAYREVKGFFKRLRERAPSTPIKYLSVCEKHESGEPHFHILLHEMDASAPIRHKQIKGSWIAGFSAAKLVVDPRQVSYVAKYLSKSLECRVRHSNDYIRKVLPKARAALAEPHRTLPAQNSTSTPAPSNPERIARGAAHTPPVLNDASVACASGAWLPSVAPE